MGDREKILESREQTPDIYSARYHVEMMIDADSATDEEWAAACKAADHSATFATYDEAVNFIREGKAKFGEAFEGGHVNRNGGIVKEVHATSPTLEQMGAEVANILQEIDYAKSRGNNVGARELERKLRRTHQDYYYSIVHFGVDVSLEQFEFAFKREIVKHKAKTEMERRNSDKYKAAVKAEAEYDARQARAIIEANASVDGIEYVAGVKSLLDKAILSGNCSDIVYYAGELKRCLGKMTVPSVAEEETGNSDSIDTEENLEERFPSFPKYVEENRSISYVKRYHGRNEADYYADYLAERNLVIEPTDEDRYEDAEDKVQIIRDSGEIKFYGYEDNIKDRVVNGTLGRKTTKRVNFRQRVELTRAEAAEIIASQGWTLERYLEMWLAKEAVKTEEAYADWKRMGYTVEYVSKAWNPTRAAEYAEYLKRIAASDLEEAATEIGANANMAVTTDSDKIEDVDPTSVNNGGDDEVTTVETPKPAETPVDSDTASLFVEVDESQISKSPEEVDTFPLVATRKRVPVTQDLGNGELYTYHVIFPAYFELVIDIPKKERYDCNKISKHKSFKDAVEYLVSQIVNGQFTDPGHWSAKHLRFRITAVEQRVWGNKKPQRYKSLEEPIVTEEGFDAKVEKVGDEIVSAWVNKNAGLVSDANECYRREMRRQTFRANHCVNTWGRSYDVVPLDFSDIFTAQSDETPVEIESETPAAPINDSEIKTEIDSDAAIATLSSLALSALVALFNVIKVPDKSAPAEATATEEAPVAQPVEKAAAVKGELDATRERIARTQDAIKQNTRRLMKLDAKVHGLGTELDFYAKAFNEALVDNAIGSYSVPLDELTYIAGQIGVKLIDKAKAETAVATLRARIAKSTARLEKLSTKLASLEVGMATVA